MFRLFDSTETLMHTLQYAKLSTSFGEPRSENRIVPESLTFQEDGGIKYAIHSLKKKKKLSKHSGFDLPRYRLPCSWVK